MEAAAHVSREKTANNLNFPITLEFQLFHSNRAAVRRISKLFWLIAIQGNNPLIIITAQ